MDSTPLDEDQDHTVSVTDLRRPPPDCAEQAAHDAEQDQTAHDAEQIVWDAWIQVLAARRDQAYAAMLAAAALCDDARRGLARILVERAPIPIATAHTALEEALATGRQAARSYEHAQEGLARELELLARRNIQRRMDACIARNGEAVPPIVQTE